MLNKRCISLKEEIEDMYRVLHIMGGADAGGISAVVLNYMKYIEKEKFHFDIALTGNKPGMHGHEMIKLGATCYELPMKSKGVKQFQKSLYKLLTVEHFDAVHIHESSTSYVALRVAKKAGVKCRVAHAHTTVPYNSVKGELKRLSGCLFNYYYATKVVGCGRLAGERVFGKKNMTRKKAIVLPNSVETQKFKFAPYIREEVRRELGMEDKYVVGMVGRLSPQKNHFFALDMFAKAHELNSKLMLVLVGTGEDEEHIKEIISEQHMETYVKMLGKRSDIDRLYQGFDACILPSVFEGFPVAAVEAMASGLPVLLSDSITDELKFGTAVQYIPLNNKNLWADALYQLSLKNTTNNRVIRQDEVNDNGFDIKQTVQILESIYLE